VPTYAWLGRFSADFKRLSPAQQAAFLIAVRQFVEDLQAGQGFRKGLRVKGIQGASGIYEMTWAGDGRATLEFAAEVTAGQAHVVWRRIGTHAIFTQP
jgi:hypothetical protein